MSLFALITRTIEACFDVNLCALAQHAKAQSSGLSALAHPLTWLARAFLIMRLDAGQHLSVIPGGYGVFWDPHSRSW